MSQLLHLAGPRPRMSPAARQRGREAARAAWQSKVRHHAAQRRRRVLLAAAAVCAVAAGGLWLWLAPWAGGPWLTGAPRPLGQVAALAGEVSAWTGESAPAPLTLGQGVPAGVELRTGQGYLALSLGDASLRLDHDSRLTLVGERRVMLARGAVYLDSGSAAGSGGFTVATPLGVAEDVGTQFAVRLQHGALRVAVREGEVKLDTGEVARTAAAGTALTVHADGTVEESAVSAHGEDWAWVLAAAPPFALEGESVQAFLDWVCRETGWELRYTAPEVAAAAARTIAHGSLAGLTPDQAPALVLPPADLAYQVEDGVLTVRAADL